MDVKTVPLTISLVQLLIEPGQFFMDITRVTSWKKAAGFLVLGSVFYALASLLIENSGQIPWLMGGIFFFNALGSALIACLIAHGIVRVIRRQRTPFMLFFMIHAFAWGITLFLSWLPFLLWLTEPWKWGLVYLGYRNGCGFGRKTALAVMVGTLAIQFSLFYWVMPIVAS